MPRAVDGLKTLRTQGSPHMLMHQIKPQAQSRHKRLVNLNRSSKTNTSQNDRKKNKKKMTLEDVRKQVKVMMDSDQLLMSKIFDDATIEQIYGELSPQGSEVTIVTPRDLSFKNAKDSWLNLGQDGREMTDYAWLLWSIADAPLRKRHGRNESRKVKRRDRKYDEMKMPRAQEKEALSP